ncbi:MAG TPA: oligosaccharide flippase family protein [Flavitalea sp.]|nr:oligosaccharide flippase family protein [Flavitalea sp.]
MEAVKKKLMMNKDIKLSSIRVVGILLGLVIQILFIKYIGSSQYGVYVLFSSWSNIFSNILVLGFDILLVKELSHLFILGEKSKFKYVLNRMILLVSINCLIFLVISVTIPISYLRSTFFSNELLESTWLLIAFGSVIFTAFQLMGRTFIAIQKVELSFLRSEVIYKFFLLICVLWFFVSFRSELGINIILAGAVVSYALTILFFLFFDKNKVKRYQDIDKTKIKISRENYVFFFINITFLLISQIDKMYLGKVASVNVLGTYGLAVSLVYMVNFSVAGYQRFIPKISHFINTNAIDEMQKEFKIVVRNAIIIALPAMMFLFVFADSVLLFFGAHYVVAANTMRVLIFGQWISFFTGPNSSLLINGKNGRVDLINLIVVLLLTTILMVIFYRLFGLIGVAIATTTGLTVINIVRVIEVKFFYKILTFEYQNLLLTAIVLSAFYIVRLVRIVPDNIILMLSINLLVGTLIAVLMTAAVSRFIGIKLVPVNIEKYLNRTFILNILKRLR